MVIRDFLFADDCALNASTEQMMQHEIDCFSKAWDNFSLTIRTKKTEVMCQPAPGKPGQEPHITLNRQDLQAVEDFTYLGSTISQEVNIDTEVKHRIAKAFGSLLETRKKVWE